MKEILYLKEFQYYDGEDFVTFNIYYLNREKNVVTLVVTNRGKISILDYDLYENENGLYFEYGPSFNKIHIDDFEECEQ